MAKWTETLQLSPWAQGHRTYSDCRSRCSLQALLLVGRHRSKPTRPYHTCSAGDSDHVRLWQVTSSCCRRCATPVQCRSVSGAFEHCRQRFGRALGDELCELPRGREMFTRRERRHDIWHFDMSLAADRDSGMDSAGLREFCFSVLAPDARHKHKCLSTHSSMCCDLISLI